MQALASDAEAVSFLTPIGYQCGSCGYCKGENTSQRTPNSRASFYALSKTLTSEIYQDLVDRGWRRSGTTFYKPDVLRACCPHYTIRLPVAEFKPTRDQRHAINRWNKFVLGEDYIKEAAKLYPKSKGEKKRQRSEFDLVSTVHESEYSTLKIPPEPTHRFEVTLEPDTFTEEKFSLYQNYQSNVHHESPSEISRNGFRRFLCNSPLSRTTRTVDGKIQNLGSFHQCYRLDGRLICMGVLDLLPHCVSGVYFLYHEDFEKWSFGKISALREAALALEGGYQFYYMGYYIHECVKMRYKGDYKPQYVLDPESYEWNPLEGEIRELMDRKKYVSLSKEKRLQNKEDASTTQKVGSYSNEMEETDVDIEQQDMPRYDTPSAAADAFDSGISLFELGMPGIMTPEQVASEIDLDDISINLGRMGIRKTEELVAWEKGSLLDSTSVKGFIAQFAAAVGPKAASSMVVSFQP